MNQKYIESKQGKTYYWTEGSNNDCIVFLHGATADHLLFKHQFEVFKHHFKVIAIDAPLHGKSKPYLNFSLENASKELKNILDKEQINKAHFVGQSMGGLISQIFTREYPERVNSITLVGSTPLFSEYYSKTDIFWLKITPWLLYLYPYNFLLKSIAKQVSVTEEGKKYMFDTLKKHSIHELVRILRGVFGEFSNYLKNEPLKVPIFVTYGKKDKTGKVQEYCNRWTSKEKLPLTIIPNAAHNANLDNPDFFNQLLKDILNNAVPNTVRCISNSGSVT